MSIQKAYYGAGCFWGVEYFFQQQKGVQTAISGYMGGHIHDPGYRLVCTGTSGHIEVVEVTYDDTIVNYTQLTKLFFNIHDCSQTNGQGPDIGSQYLSAIFYGNTEQKSIAEDIIIQIQKKGIHVATSLHSTLNTPFFAAEDYHQDYYFKTGKMPYCHSLKEII
jgi:peptide methionine sulfoxide reductase msrA/msrB